MRSRPRTHPPLPLVCLLLLLRCALARADTTYRITDLDLRDPHVFVNLFGCRDFTDTDIFGQPGYNTSLQNSITMDEDGDGYLDLSFVIGFRPLDQGGPGGTLDFGKARCTAPMSSTTCEPDPTDPPAPYAYANHGAGTCLGTVAGTLRPYVPPVTVPGAPCFALEPPVDVTVELAGLRFPLRGAQLAATYQGDPATALVNGLLRAFLTQAAADTLIIPPSYPIVGGQPVSSILPGGQGCCAAHSDRDVLDGEPGWWFYFNFTAAPVPYSQPIAVGPAAPVVPQLSAALPNPFQRSTLLRYTLARTGFIRLSVVDAHGRLVAELFRGERPPGAHQARWDGRDLSGSPARSGLYFVTLESQGMSRTRKIALLR